MRFIAPRRIRAVAPALGLSLCLCTSACEPAAVTTGSPGPAGTNPPASETVAATAVNDCQRGDWVDATGRATVDIRFGGPLGRNYSPRCVEVSPGTRIRFLGPFDTHPLVGGRLERGLPVPGQGSARFSPVASGDGAEFELGEPGEFGYYCDLHAVDGMLGAVRVLARDRASRS